MVATLLDTWRPTETDLRAYALHAGVCVRPVLREVVDTWTGDTQVIPIRCGTVREDKCPPCAARNRSLRMSQCAEGWHLADDPLRVTGTTTPVDQMDHQDRHVEPDHTEAPDRNPDRESAPRRRGDILRAEQPDEAERRESDQGSGEPAERETERKDDVGRQRAQHTDQVRRVRSTRRRDGAVELPRVP